MLMYSSSFLPASISEINLSSVRCEGVNRPEQKVQTCYPLVNFLDRSILLIWQSCVEHGMVSTRRIVVYRRRLVQMVLRNQEFLLEIPS